MKKLIKQLWFKRAVALLLFVLLFFVVDFRAAFSRLLSTDPFLLSFLIALSFVMVFVSAFKWKRLLEAQGIEVSLLRVNGLYLFGYFINMLAPSYLGGDAARSWVIAEDGQKHSTFAATILERYSGLLAMSGLAALFAIFLEDLNAELRLGALFIFFGLLSLAGLALSAKLLAFVKTLCSSIAAAEKVFAQIEKLQDALRSYSGHRQALVEAALLSLLFHSLTALNTYVALLAVGGPSVSFLSLYVLLPFILLLAALPISPSGLGVQEGAFVFFLGLLGVSAEIALAAALLLRAKAYLLALCGGLYWYGTQRSAAIGEGS